MTTPITPLRLPLDGVNAFDIDEVRAWILAMVEEYVRLQGQPTPALHLFYDGHREVIDLPPLLAADPDFQPAALYAQQAARREVRAAVLVAMLEKDEGEPARAALALCVEHEDGRPAAWWARWRPYHMQPDGLGAFAGEWEGAQGQGPPPEPFASLVSAAPDAPAPLVLPGRMPEPDIRAAVHELPPEARLPTDASGMTELAMASTLPQVLREGFDHARVFRLRGRELQLWELRGDHLPSGIDDFVRSIAAWGEPAEAVALVTAGRFEEQGAPVKCLRVVAEHGDARAERIVVLHPGPDGRHPVAGNLYLRTGRVEPGRGWLGVEPMVAWQLYVKEGEEEV